MNRNEYVIRIEEGMRPYNTYMVLPLHILEQVTPLLKNEILKGLVSSDHEDRVILHLLLDSHKIEEVRKLAARQKDKLSFSFK